MAVPLHTAGACKGLNLMIFTKNEEILTCIKTLGQPSAWLGASPDFRRSIQVQ